MSSKTPLDWREVKNYLMEIKYKARTQNERSDIEDLANTEFL